MKGLVFDIQRFSLQDGPGIRTTVFLKGCALNCKWCHNPESISDKPELGYIEPKCVHCGACVLMCPYGAITVDRDAKKWEIDRKKCDGCGMCVISCFTEALTIAGKEMDADEIIAEVVKDDSYYKESGGGLTVSGGEPMNQFDFLNELLQKAKEKNIPVALETSGIASQRMYEQILPLVDIFLFDYKATGEEDHKKLTGVNQNIILKNFQFLYARKAKIELRCPLVHGVNDSAQHLEAIAAFEKQNPDLTAIRILPYHNTGNSKYSRYGIENPLPGNPTTSDEVKDAWKRFFEAKGCSKIVIE